MIIGDIWWYNGGIGWYTYLRYYIVELALVEYMRLLYRAFITFVVKDPNFCMYTFDFGLIFF